MQSGRSNDLRSAWPELAELLRQLRDSAGLTTRQLADRLGAGWYQAKVSRIQKAVLLPTVDDVRAWLAATGATPEQTAAALQLTDRAQHEVVNVRAARRAGLIIDLEELQRQVQQAEAAARLNRVFAPTFIPALLQTPDYARQVVTALEPDNPTLAAGIAARMQRQAILYQEDHRFEFIIGEAALHWRYGPIAIQVGQLRQLLTLSTLGNVLIAVLPLDHETPAWHSIGFTLYEQRADDADPLVVLEALETFEVIANPRLAGRYQQTLDALRELAAVGNEARALIERLIEDHPTTRRSR